MVIQVSIILEYNGAEKPRKSSGCKEIARKLEQLVVGGSLIAAVQALRIVM